MNLDQRRDLVVNAFIAAYGDPPSIWTRAPRRGDVLGSHPH